jgi:hypothetical protein
MLITLWLGVVSCGLTLSPLSSSGIVGIWSGKSEAKGITVSATLELHSDGTFEATDFPEVLGDYDVPLISTIDGAGKWQLDHKKYGEQILRLYFDTVGGEKPGYNTFLEIASYDADCPLYGFVGDPDNMERYCFVRDKQDAP